MSEAIGELARRLPRRPHLLLDGPPSLIWRIAPQFGRALVITLLDVERSALEMAFADIADAAEAHGIVVSWPGRALLLHVAAGAWRIEAAVVPALSAQGLRRLGGDALVVHSAVPAELPPMPVLMLDLPSAPPSMLPVMHEPWLRVAWAREHAGLARRLDGLCARGWRLARWPRRLSTPRGDGRAALRSFDRLAFDVGLMERPLVRQWRRARERQGMRGRLIVRQAVLDVLAELVALNEPVKKP